MSKKTSNLMLRVSEEWKRDLERICKNKGRSMTGHVEHALKIAKLVTEFCDGNDDLESVERTLRELREKTRFLIAAESGRYMRLPRPKKTTYQKKKK